MRFINNSKQPTCGEATMNTLNQSVSRRVGFGSSFLVYEYQMSRIHLFSKCSWAFVCKHCVGFVAHVLSCHVVHVYMLRCLKEDPATMSLLQRSLDPEKTLGLVDVLYTAVFDINRWKERK